MCVCVQKGFEVALSQEFACMLKIMINIAAIETLTSFNIK